MVDSISTPPEFIPTPLHERRGFVSAATQIQLANVRDVSKLARTRQAWQADAFMFNKEVGELGYISEYVGDVLSRLRLFAAEQREPEDEPVPTKHDVANRAMEELDSSEVGQNGLSRSFGRSILVAGECFLINHGDTPSSWDIYSVREVEVGSDRKVKIRHSPKSSVADLEVLPPNTFVMRIWRRDIEWRNLAHSHYRTLLDSAESLLIEERAARAIARSRMASAGMLLLPQESFPPQVQPDGTLTKHPVQQELERLMIAAIQDEGQPSAVVPLVLSIASQYIEHVKHITFDRTLDVEREKRMEGLLRRLAQGLPIPPEVILGTAGLSHWTAWSVDENVWKAHMEPMAIMWVDALTTRYLRPLLEESGMPADEARLYRIWYDASKVVSRPDKGQSSTEGHKLGILSDEAWRRIHGMAEEDAPEFLELLRRIAYNAADAATFLQTAQPGDLPPEMEAQLGIEPLRAVNPEDVSEEMLDTLDAQRQLQDILSGQPAALSGPPVDENGNPIEPEGAGGPPSQEASRKRPPSGNPPAQVASARGPSVRSTEEQGRSSLTAAPAGSAQMAALGPKLHQIDQALSERLLAGTDAILRQAIDRAGARIRQAAKKDRTITAAIEAVPHSLVASTLGPAVVASLGISEREVVEDTVAEFRGRFDQWVGRAQASAVKAARWAGGDQVQLELDQRADREAAWTWLRVALVDQAVGAFYTPGLDPDPEGELDDTVVVPYDIIREAMARAGGASDSSEVSLTAALPRILPHLKRLGLAAGARILKWLEPTGIVTVGNQWIYGEIPRKEFPPHKALDGVQFRDWEDEALSADPTHFPYQERYAPGDHKGCRCSAQPSFDWLPGRAEPIRVPSV